MRKFIVLFFLLSTFYSNSQVAINNTGAAPNPSAMLDITYPIGLPKGILIPRMGEFTRTQIPNPSTGLLVFQNTDPTGFYYYDFDGWKAITNMNTSWNINGNSGLSSSNFVGTTDNSPLRFRQNGIPSGIINGAKNNTVIGYNTLYAASGESITAFGSGALKSVGFIEEVIGIGVGALGSVVGQGGNIAIGDSAMYGFVNAGVPFSDNTVVGRRAYKTAITGSDNTLIGGEVMQFATGKRNVVIGEGAMHLGTGGDDNIGIGRDALRDNSGGNLNVFIGSDAGRPNLNGSNNVGIGQRVLFSATTTSRVVAIGDSAMAAYSSVSPTQPQNTAIGYRSMATLTNGAGNTAIGYTAMYSAASDSRFNVAVGAGAMGNSAANDYNTAVGYQAMNVANGTQNTVVGAAAMSIATGGDNNTAVGYRALYNASGLSNTAVGHQALDGLSTGASNTAVGKDALGAVSVGEQNVSVGVSAGSLINAGSRNSFLGYDADAAFTDLNNATAIGNASRVYASDNMSFGNTSITAWTFGMNAAPAAGRALQVGLVGNPGNGAYLTDGGVWTNGSDVNRKEDFTQLDQSELLQKIGELPITRWRYKGTNEYHIGPMAQDFHHLFNTGIDDKTISTIDPSGIALAAIKALIKQNEALQQQIDELKKIVETKK